MCLTPTFYLPKRARLHQDNTPLIMESENVDNIVFIQSKVTAIAEGMRVTEFVAFQHLKHLLLTNPETKHMIPKFLEMVSV